MEIRILSVGKIKEKYLRDGIAEYSKRLSKYCRLSFEQVPDEKTPDGVSGAERLLILQTEGERLLRLVRDRDFCIALAIEGSCLTSEAFAQKMDQLALSGISYIDFIIGGSLGLSSGVMQRADLALSFSRFTFPHQLMQLILLEQIYRSFRISRHEPYHK